MRNRFDELSFYLESPRFMCRFWSACLRLKRTCIFGHELQIFLNWQLETSSLSLCQFKVPIVFCLFFFALFLKTFFFFGKKHTTQTKNHFAQLKEVHFFHSHTHTHARARACAKRVRERETHTHTQQRNRKETRKTKMLRSFQPRTKTIFPQCGENKIHSKAVIYDAVGIISHLLFVYVRDFLHISSILEMY